MRLFGSFTVWSMLGLSLGWYYTVTYFGRVGWPMPSVETLGALLLYYFSVINAATEIQALHWMLVFPLSGFLWTGIAWIFLRPNESLPRLAWLLSLCSLPLCLPAPYLMFLAGQTGEGWDIARMLAVALRRGNLAPWPSLSPTYLALGLVALSLHMRILRRASQPPWPIFLRNLLAACLVYVVAVALLGSLLSFPLRAVWE